MQKSVSEYLRLEGEHLQAEYEELEKQQLEEWQRNEEQIGTQAHQEEQQMSTEQEKLNIEEQIEETEKLCLQHLLINKLNRTPNYDGHMLANRALFYFGT